MSRVELSSSSQGPYLPGMNQLSRALKKLLHATHHKDNQHHEESNKDKQNDEEIKNELTNIIWDDRVVSRPSSAWSQLHIGPEKGCLLLLAQNVYDPQTFLLDVQWYRKNFFIHWQWQLQEAINS